MPTVSVLPDVLFEQIGTRYSVEDFENLCFRFGIEFDGEELDESGVNFYRIEVPANRTDLLCVEGIGRALRVYNGSDSPPTYRLSPASLQSQLKLTVKASTAAIRPFGFAAVLRGVQLTPNNYKSFIDLQDRLHHNIARRRQLVAIGTHDLSTLAGPFIYAAEDPQQIRFIPLNQTQEVDGHGLMQLLSTHAQLKSYLLIIKDSPVYPVIRDSTSLILSVPPIINGNHSKMTLEKTKDIFIEVTATDRTKGSHVLSTLVAMFSQYCEEPFHIEPVVVEYEQDHPLLGGKSFVNPELKETEFKTDAGYIQRVTGIKSIAAKHCCELLSKMMIHAIPSEDPLGNLNHDGMILARVPITRKDILHPCDLAEDISIAYGYNNIVYSPFTCGSEQPYMALSNQVRTEFANCGYHETLTWGLCSMKEGFEFLNRKWRDARASPLKDYEYDALSHPVELTNPKTREFEIVRTSLLPGLLKTLAANKAQVLPIRLFEIGEVVCIDPTTETGARSSRYCAALIANHSGSGLEHIHGLLDLILSKLCLIPEYYEMIQTFNHAAGLGSSDPSEQRIYKLELSNDDQAFLLGRCVRIVVQPENIQLGLMGVLHPSVLKAFNVTLPCSVFEFSLEPFLQWLPEARVFDE